MKKTTFSFATAVLASGIAFSTIGNSARAQTGFDFGLRTVIQTSSLLNTTDQAAGPELDFSQKVGVAYGVAAGYSFSEHAGVELNILSVKQDQGYKGVVSKIDPTAPQVLCYDFQGLAGLNSIPFTGNYTADVILNCIKIPVMFRFTTGNSKMVYFSLLAGPQINLISSVKYKINGQDATLAGTNSSLSDMYKKTTFDGVLGLGLGVNVSDNFSITAHLRLDYGFSDVENKNGTFTTLPPNPFTSKFYGDGRAATHDASGGLMIGINYKLVKKEASGKAKK